MTTTGVTSNDDDAKHPSVEQTAVVVVSKMTCAAVAV